jgi:hypothetical protein
MVGTEVAGAGMVGAGVVGVWEKQDGRSKSGRNRSSSMSIRNRNGKFRSRFGGPFIFIYILCKD